MAVRELLGVGAGEETAYQTALDANVASASNPPDAVATASNVGLLDTSSLKEYLPFGQVSGGRLSDCTCSVDTVVFDSAGRAYLAAVVAAPPPSTTRVTLVTGIGSIPNLPISG